VFSWDVEREIAPAVPIGMGTNSTGLAVPAMCIAAYSTPSE
jgi:hypothetical protein